MGRHLTRCSAEAAAGLAAMHSILGKAEPILSVNSSRNPCEKILAGERNHSSPWVSLVLGGAAMPVREVDVSKVDDIASAVENMLGDILKVKGPVREHFPKLKEVFNRTLTEALLNVHEHAYLPGSPNRAWVSVVCFPAGAMPYETETTLSDQEKDYLRPLQDKYVLEIAVADAGIGIPRTLAASAESIMPELLNHVRHVSSGRNVYEVSRAKIHAALCYYSLNHYSTSKNEKSKTFKTPEHALNWRGLYRCYRQVAELGGSIAVTSGRGRAGYASFKEEIRPFQVVTLGETDFPGTLLSIRLPLPIVRRTSHVPKSQSATAPIKMQEEPIPLGRMENLTGFDPVKEARFEKALQFVSVTTPFVELTLETDSIKPNTLPFPKFRQIIRNVALHSIPIFCFLEMRPDWKAHLRAFTASEKWSSAFDGPPRLVGFLTAKREIHWVFVGAIPQEAEQAVLQLESQGRVSRRNMSSIVKTLCHELLSHHPNAIFWDAGSHEFGLHHHHALMLLPDYLRALTSAFNQFWAIETVKAEVITSKRGKVILLPTGTCVRNHFSVFKLLNHCPALTGALGRAFGSRLDEIFEGGRITIVLDQPSSRYVAHALLEDIEGAFDTYSVDELVGRDLPTSNVVLFADSIFKGHTASRAVEEIRSLGYQVSDVIAVADLRADRSPSKIAGAPFWSLIIPEGFEAIVVPVSGKEDKIQTDAITNVPLLETASTFVEITEDEERRQLLINNPKFFCAGYHVRSGRTHTYSIPLRGLLTHDSGEGNLAEWFVRLITRNLQKLGKSTTRRDLVLFSWFDSRVGTLVERVAALLREPPHEVGGVFSVKMPIVYRGQDIIYPRAGSDPLAGCSEIVSDGFSFVGRSRPNEGYIAIYLADSAVTGNSLREFLYRLTKAQNPNADVVIAIVGVNRLNPAEVRFFELIHGLSGMADHRLSFAYDYLFTLQIRSVPGRGPIWNPLLEAALTDPGLRVGELRDYIAQIALRAEQLENQNPLLHLFCPEASPETLPYEVVRFRHLLALNQQNEPVTIDIIALVDKLTKESTEEPALLTVLALEPDLLNDPPLRQFARPAIMRMAVRVLRNPDRSLALKSDALTVMAAFPHGLKQNLTDVASEIFATPTLWRQLAVLLLVQQRRLGEPAAPLIEACLAFPFKDKAIAANLSHTVSVATELQRANREQGRNSDYGTRIQNLGSHLLHHAESLERDWDGVDLYLFSLIGEWRENDPSDVVRKSKVIDLLSRGCKFAQNIIIPSFTSIAYFARHQAQVELANSLEDGQIGALGQLRTIENLIPSEPALLTKDLARRLFNAFQKLRKTTWYSPSSERLSRSDFSANAVGALPKAMNDVFSAPSNLLINVAEEIFGAVESFLPSGEFRSGDTPLHLTVCPVPRETVEHIFRLLLNNIRERTDVEPVVAIPAGYPLPSSDGTGTHTWAIEIFNNIDRHPSGTGRGIEIARSRASRYMVRIESSPLTENKVWRTMIAIPNCFYFKPIA